MKLFDMQVGVVRRLANYVGAIVIGTLLMSALGLQVIAPSKPELPKCVSLVIQGMTSPDKVVHGSFWCLDFQDEFGLVNSGFGIGDAALLNYAKAAPVETRYELLYTNNRVYFFRLTGAKVLYVYLDYIDKEDVKVHA